MAIEKPAPWTGASGTAYDFHVFGLEPDVPKRPGNYIYAKRNEAGAWVPIYMGHGDLSLACTDPGLRRCIATKGATHIHLRLNSLELDREAELKDLLAHYVNAFAPEGCHPAVAPARGRASGSRDDAGRRSTKTPSVNKTPAAKKTPATKKASAKKSAPKKATPKKVAPKPAAKKELSGKAKPRAPRPPSR